jgi:YD repeat-containing protein
LSATLVTDVSHGYLMLDTNGGFTYSPEAGFVGTDSFTYYANDGAANSNTVTVTITVVNLAPTAGTDAYYVDKDQNLYVVPASGVLVNDSDLDFDPLTANLISDVSHGYLMLDPNGSFSYVPDEGFVGTDSFTYQANDGASNSATTTVTLFVGTVASTAVLTPDALRPNQEQVHGAFYSIALASGELTAGYSLPAYNGRETLRLVYNSATAAPNPIFVVRHTLSDTAVPDSVGATLTLNGVAGTEVFFDTSSLATEDLVQIAVQGDATGLATGRYSYQIDVTEYFTTPVTTPYTGYVNIINNADSAFGAGWSIQGLERLWPVSGGAILEMAGGVSMWFEEGSTAGTFVSPAGDFSTLVQNLDDTYTRTLKNGVTIEFDADGRPTAIEDRNGNSTTFGYSSGKMISITDPFSSVTTLTYDGDLVEEITDPADRDTILAYDTNGRLISITAPDPDGTGSATSPVTSLAYDGDGRLTDWTDPRSNTTTFAYNFAGRIATVTRPDDSEELVSAAQMVGLAAPGYGTELDPAPAVLAGPVFATYTDPNENTWSWRLDDLGFGLATQTTDPLSNTTNLVRNADGLITDVVDPLQRVTSYVYDSQGNATSVLYADGAVYQYAHNSFGQVTQVTEPDPDGAGSRLGSITEYVFDSNGNLIETILPDDDTNATNNPTYASTYDSKGLLLSSTDPEANTTAFDYDTEGRLILTTYADDAEVSMTYDAAGNVASVTNERGFTTAYAFDNLGRLTTITLPDDDTNSSNNPQETLTYDAAGNVTALTNPLGHTTSFTVNAMNRIASMTGPDPDGTGPLAAAVTSFGYDAVGNRTSVTDPIGRVAASQYDAANRLTQTSVNGNYQTDYGYDAASQLVSVSSPAPVASSPSNRLVTENTYDPRGRMISTSDSTGRLRISEFNLSGELVGFT